MAKKEESIDTELNNNIFNYLRKNLRININCGSDKVSVSLFLTDPKTGKDVEVDNSLDYFPDFSGGYK